MNRLDKLGRLKAQAEVQAEQQPQRDADAAAAFRDQVQALFPQAIALRNEVYDQLDAALKAKGYPPLDRRLFRLTENGHVLAPYVKGRKADGSNAIGYRIQECAQ
jgi:hypothetical protein